MKQTGTTALLFAALLLAASSALAQGTDTLVVYASGETLDNVINSDTTGTGALKHKVYKLVSLDTTYLYKGAVTVKSDITVLGVPDAVTGRPPCIQPDVLGNGSIPGTMFSMNGNDTKGTFKNLYLLGLSINNSPEFVIGTAIQISADRVRLVVDNCVFEEWMGFAIGYNGVNDKFFITNSKFRNMVHPNQWYVGEVLRNEYPGSVPTDSIVFRNNTMFCLNGYAAAPVTKFYVSYFEFTHNSIIYNFKNPFFIFNVTNAKLNDNIFYATYAGGISKTEYPWWDQLWSPEVGSVIDMDRLDAAKDSVFDPVDVGNPLLDSLAETKRNVEVKNNAYFWPSALTSFWTAWNDTATVDSIYTPTWMNARTTNMFTDKTRWPHFVESGNMNADPGFGASITSVLTQTPNGLLDWFVLCRTNTLSNTYWDYEKTQVGAAADWVPAWPLPEANDMKYSNTAMKTGGTDGLALGDPNWFGQSTQDVPDAPTGIAREFALSQNFPNPFNPTTTIDFAIPHAAKVRLSVYNILGQEVATLVNGTMAPGQHSVTFNASTLASGIYMYKIVAGSYMSTMKMVLMK